jgi:superfamily II DNA helicase RecQ
MEQLNAQLVKVFGFESFRPGQRQVIEHLLQGRHTLAVLPTGSGISLCFQLTAQMLSGLTLVVSPLIALMQYQVEGLIRRGIGNATCLSSALDSTELATPISSTLPTCAVPSRRLSTHLRVHAASARTAAPSLRPCLATNTLRRSMTR